MKKITATVATLAMFTQLSAGNYLPIEKDLKAAAMQEIVYKSYGDFSKRSIAGSHIEGDIAEITIKVIDPEVQKHPAVQFFPGGIPTLEKWTFKKTNGAWDLVGEKSVEN